MVMVLCCCDSTTDLELQLSPQLIAEVLFVRLDLSYDMQITYNSVLICLLLRSAVGMTHGLRSEL